MEAKISYMEFKQNTRHSPDKKQMRIDHNLHQPFEKVFSFWCICPMATSKAVK